jgi:hypothetical protein
MRSIDKLLVGFVAGIVMLVATVFFMEFNQPAATYYQGTEPMDVAHNYLFALQQGDYERAYAQLSSQLPSYPQDLQMFVRQVRNEPYAFPLEEEIALSVHSADVLETWARVEVRESRFYNKGPFSSSSYSSKFHLELELVEGVWKIADGDLFFIDCWTEKKCPE